MKKKVLIIAAVFALFAAVIASTQIDDELSNEALALVRVIEEPKESHAYLYFLGINAAPDADPLEVGRNLLEEYRKLEADKNYEVVEYNHPDQIQAPEGELFCSFSDDDCVRTLFTSDFDIEELQWEYAIVLKRMERLHGFGDYHSLSKPTYSEPIPPYQYIPRVERIWVLRSISLYKEGKAKEALMLLMNRLSVLRSSLASQDNLIGKMVHLAAISEIVDAASVIRADSADATKMEMIPDLTLSEKELDVVSAREFGLAYYLFKDLDGHSEFFKTSGLTQEEEIEEGEKGEKKVPAWLIRLFYKPNMSINAIAPHYTRMARLSRLTPREFAMEIDGGKELEAETSMFRNYIGHLLLSYARPDTNRYVARIMDLETKIELFNKIHHFGVPENKLNNPYYEGEFAFRKGSSVCFRGPFKDERGMRCLRTKY
jgi:hypothetical protein